MGLNQLLVIFAVLLTRAVYGTELTFELPDKEKMCFHEHVEKGEQATLLFQVVYGGNNDVDMELSAPNGQLLYKQARKESDSFTWTAQYAGVNTFCFSNEFSTFTHKLVFFQIQVGDDDDQQLLFQQLQEQEEKTASAMTMVESASAKIHTWLSTVSKEQVFFRNREAGGRQFAEDLNSRVIMWSIGETVAILMVGLGQVLVLRSFFSGPSPRSNPSSNGCIST